jgi:hypothetical protein
MHIKLEKYTSLILSFELFEYYTHVYYKMMNM